MHRCDYGQNNSISQCLFYSDSCTGGCNVHWDVIIQLLSNNCSIVFAYSRTTNRYVYGHSNNWGVPSHYGHTNRHSLNRHNKYIRYF